MCCMNIYIYISVVTICYNLTCETCTVVVYKHCEF